GLEKRLLVGARSGIIELDPYTVSQNGFIDSSVVSQLGFNQSVIWNNEIWASHSEAGIVAWHPQQPQQPMLALRPVNLMGLGAKNLAILDNSRLAFSGSNRLMVLSREGGEGELKVSVRAAGADLRAEIVGVLLDS